jgi:hypothetical protein
VTALAAFVMLGAAKARASDATTPAPALPNGATVMERCVRAWYYAGKDMVAKIRMEIVDRSGGKHYRLMTGFRKNEPGGGEQRYLLYFHEPGDVRRMTCMVWKHVGGDDERWMFVPAVNRVRRVAAPERSRFLGSDFVREEYAGRDAAADSHAVARFERLDGHPCWVVESKPITPAEFSRVTTWVDTTTCLPWKQEFRDRHGEVFRTFTADKVKEIRTAAGEKIPTIMERTMWARGKTNCTRLIYLGVRYNVGLTDKDFAEKHLEEPLEAWYQGPRP